VATSLKALLSLIENLAVKGMVPTVNVKWEASQSAEEKRSSHSHRTEVAGALAVRTKNGFWPIPESTLYLDSNIGSHMPARRARPTLVYVTEDTEPPRIPSGFPVDRYEVEPCTMTVALCARPGVCWRCYMPNSMNDGRLGEPFGFVRAEPGHQTASLTILPYGFPRLWVLLDKLQGLPNGATSSLWNHDFHQYLRAIPPYYLRPLREAMKRCATTQHVNVPDGMDPGLPHQMANYLMKLKNQTRNLTDRFERDWDRAEEAKTAAKATSGTVKRKIAPASKPEASVGPSVSFRKWLKPNSEDTTASSAFGGEVAKPTEESIDELAWSSPNDGLEQGAEEGTGPVDFNLNTFDMDRTSLLRHLAVLQKAGHRARGATTGTLTDNEARFRVPINSMGLYQDVIAKKEIIRNPLLDDAENKALSRPTFGNPFARLGNKTNQSMDEAADEAGAFDKLGGGPGHHNAGQGINAPQLGGGSPGVNNPPAKPSTSPRGSPRSSPPLSPATPPADPPSRDRDLSSAPPRPPPKVPKTSAGSSPHSLGRVPPPPPRDKPAPPKPPPKKPGPPQKPPPPGGKQGQRPAPPPKPGNAPPPKPGNARPPPPGPPKANKPAPPRPAPPGNKPPPPSKAAAPGARPQPPSHKPPPPAKSGDTPDAKAWLVQQVKRPGKDYTALFDKLSTLRKSSAGGWSTKHMIGVLDDLVQHARTQKKATLVTQLQAFASELVQETLG